MQAVGPGTQAPFVLSQAGLTLGDMCRVWAVLLGLLVLPRELEGAGLQLWLGALGPMSPVLCTHGEAGNRFLELLSSNKAAKVRGALSLLCSGWVGAGAR